MLLYRLRQLGFAPLAALLLVPLGAIVPLGAMMPLGAPLYAQIAVANPAPQPASLSPAPAGITLKTGTRLVVVDVVVTDRGGRPVHNLKQADFSVLESKAPQTVRSFEEHIYPNPKAAPPVAMPAMPPGVFTNFYPAPAGDSLNIILLDSLNTPRQDQFYVRDQLKKYLKTARPGVRTAIFGLTTHLLLLQSFTSDPEILKSAVEAKDFSSSQLLQDPSVQSVSSQIEEASSNGPDIAQVIANLKQAEARLQDFQFKVRAKYTLDAMNLLARYLSGLPGRKNLIWFSGSFPISILPDGDLANPFAAVASFEDEFRETSNLLAAAQVAVYPIDARGLATSPVLAASNAGAPFSRNPGDFNRAEAKFLQQTTAEHSTMLQMAQQTGGQAFINTNGLSEAVATAIDSGANYYTLAYAPTDPRYDGRFRNIQVRLQQQGYNLSYRRGYYANDPEASSKSAGKSKSPTPAVPADAKAAHGSQTPPPPSDPMRAAMARGAPNPTQIIFKARILPASTATEDTIAPDNAANPDPKLSHGPYRRYLLDLAADPASVLFTRSADNLYHGDIQLRVYVYDQAGTLIVDAFSTSHANLTAANLKRLENGGIPLHQQISVPAKGEYFLRVGIHDLNGDRLGAIEVPVSALKNLTPLS